MKKHLSRAVVFVLILCTLLGSVGAAGKRFSDVPADHWATPYINALADGGLINGYNGKFDPFSNLTIDQMATIICNAKNYVGNSGSSYWGYDAVKHCRDKLHCLPNLGEINAAIYGRPCTRELAVYMIINSLGLGTHAITPNNKLMPNDIPDFDEITTRYSYAIMQAYCFGLVEGIDDKGTFAPKAYLTRDQVCTLLYRAGFTKAAEKPDNTVATGMTGEDIYSTVKTRWADVWDPVEYKGGDAKYVSSGDPVYGLLEVCLLPSGALQIVLPEKGPQLINGKWSDRFGNPLTQEQLKNGQKDENGLVLASSAWHYEGRQLAKEILALAYPESADEVYNIVLSVMKQEIYEVPCSYLPSAIRWVDGRSLLVDLDDGPSYTMYITIGAPGSTTSYNEYLADPAIGNQAKYVSYYGGWTAAQINEQYALDKG